MSQKRSKYRASLEYNALVLPCQGQNLLAVTEAASALHSIQSIFIMVMGGRQYRVGAQRHWLALSRALAQDENSAVMRFDPRGVGDSEGHHPGYAQLDAEINVAILGMQQRYPQAKKIYLCGLCDGAIAALNYSLHHTVNGVILLNPWIEFCAKLQQDFLAQPTWEDALSWQKWRRLSWHKACRLLWHWPKSVRCPPTAMHADAIQEGQMISSILTKLHTPSLCLFGGKDRMCQSWAFLRKKSTYWQQIWRQAPIQVQTLPKADHIFSTAPWQAWLLRQIHNWLQNL